MRIDEVMKLITRRRDQLSGSLGRWGLNLQIRKESSHTLRSVVVATPTEAEGFRRGRYSNTNCNVVPSTQIRRVIRH